MAAPNRRTFEFGPFRLVPEERIFLKDGENIPLAPKAFDLLVVLVENRGHLVTKDELMRQLWPDSFVEEANLSVKMSALRRALGEGPQDQHFIQTVPRKGYRFVALVTEADSFQPESNHEKPAEATPRALAPVESKSIRSSSRYWVFVPLGLGLLLILSWVVLNGFGLRDTLSGTPTAASIHSLAVLPLDNLSGDPSQEYFADGMTEALISDLARVGELRVISRTSVMQYKGAQKSLPLIGRELNVDGVIEGSVQRSGDHVKITVQLIHAASDQHLWTQTYERDIRDVLELQNEIARSITQQIKIKLSPHEQETLASAARKVDPTAYDHYLHGKFFANRQTRDDNETTIALFEKAVDADPNFAAAQAELAQAYVWRFFLFTPDEKHWEEKAFVAVEKALSLDPDLGAAHLARGRLLWTPANNYPHEKAIQEYRKAIELDPSLDEARNQLALVYNHVGAVDQALKEIQEAVATNPTNNVAQFRVGETYLFRGDYEKSLAAFNSVPESTNPALVGSQMVWALWNLGRTDEARSVMDTYLKQYPDDNRGLFTSIQAVMAAAEGKNDEAERLIAIAREKGKGFGHYHHTLFHIACAYARMKHVDRAVKELEATARDGFPCYPLFEKDPNLDNLREDPAFISFLSDLRKQWESYKNVG